MNFHRKYQFKVEFALKKGGKTMKKEKRMTFNILVKKKVRGLSKCLCNSC